jgi:hypothetical protein
MDGWSVALLAVAGYVAAMTLVRLMLARRNKLISDLREQAAAEQTRLKRKADDDDEEEAA